MATGQEQKIRIEASSGLDEAEIDRMVKEAETHAGEDREQREKADAINRAESMTYETEKNLKEMGDKISPEAKNKLEAAVGRVNEAIKAGEVGEIKSATEALEQTWQQVSTEIYQQAGAQAGPQQGAAYGAPGSGNGSEQTQHDGEDVIDADYEVVDEDKR